MAKEHEGSEADRFKGSDPGIEGLVGVEAAGSDGWVIAEANVESTLAKLALFFLVFSERATSTP